MIFLKNEAQDYNDDNISPGTYFTVANLIIGLKIYNKWRSNHLNVDNAFLNSYYDKTMWVKLLKHTFAKQEMASKVITFNQNFICYQRQCNGMKLSFI